MSLAQRDTKTPARARTRRCHKAYECLQRDHARDQHAGPRTGPPRCGSANNRRGDIAEAESAVPGWRMAVDDLFG